MRAEDIDLARTHPISGRRTASNARQPLYYADLNGVVFVVYQPRGGRGHWKAGFSTDHLSYPGYEAFSQALGVSKPYIHCDNSVQLVAQLAEYVETYEFERARYAWQTATPDPSRITSPYRVVRSAPWHYDAILNDPRGYVVTMGDPERPIYSGGHVIAQAVKYSRAETGTWSGWIVSQPSSGDHSDPIKNIPAMLTNLRSTADEIVKGMGK